MNKKLIEQTIVIVADFFNPSAFSQYWFIKEEILKEEDIQKESLFVPGITHVQTDKFNMLVVPDKIQITIKSNNEETHNTIYKLLTLIVQGQQNIPYKALGINFCWELIPQDSISIYSKNLFYKENMPLYDKFKEDNACFGVYMSQNYKNARMKLDIKPIILNDDKCMICNFNFHHDISEANDIINNLQFRKEYLNKSTEIINSL